LLTKDRRRFLAIAFLAVALRQVEGLHLLLIKVAISGWSRGPGVRRVLQDPLRVCLAHLELNHLRINPLGSSSFEDQVRQVSISRSIHLGNRRSLCGNRPGNRGRVPKLTEPIYPEKIA
jgi:hypothetical protein